MEMLKDIKLDIVQIIVMTVFATVTLIIGVISCIYSSTIYDIVFISIIMLICEILCICSIVRISKHLLSHFNAVDYYKNEINKLLLQVIELEERAKKGANNDNDEK